MPIHHIGIVVSDLPKSLAFYEATLNPLNYKIKMSFLENKVVGFGPSSTFAGPDFWISAMDTPSADGSATRHRDMMAPGTDITGNGREASGKMHVAFSASDRDQVRRFYNAAIAAGGKCNGPPGPREEYFSTYYGAFILDPEGRNIEAVCLKPAFWAEPWGVLGWSAFLVGLVGVAGAVASYLDVV